MTKVLGLWEHVFHGTIQGDKVQGVAVDVPLAPGAALNSAALAIDCGGQAARTLTMTSDGPAWADHRWDKIYDTPRFVPHPHPSPHRVKDHPKTATTRRAPCRTGWLSDPVSGSSRY
jgi:hypothetical protein